MIISITNQKGGVGKTTTAINLSACLAIMGYNILLIDADSQGNTTSGLGISKINIKKSFYDFLINNEDLNEVIVKTNIDNLSVMPANSNLSAIEIEIVDMEEREFILKKRLNQYINLYDFIIIDSPPTLNLMTINIMSASDKILIPMQAEYYSLEGLASLMETYKRVKNSFNPKLSILGILITMYSSNNNLSKEVNHNIRQAMKNLVFDTIIPRNIRLAESPSHCMPIILYDIKSSGALSYQALAKEIIEKIGK